MLGRGESQRNNGAGSSFIWWLHISFHKNFYSNSALILKLIFERRINSMLKKFAIIFRSEFYLDPLDFIWCHSFKFVQWFNSGKLQIQSVYKWPAAFSSKDGIFCSTCLLLVLTLLSFICCFADDVGSLPVDVYVFFLLCNI